MNQYYCRKTQYPLNIDGDVKKPLWEQAEKVFLVDTVTGQPPRQKTWCKLLWDEDFLYAAFYCEDDYINAGLTGYNDKIYEEEVVEIFLDDNCDLKTYIEIELSPLNTLLHYSMHNDLRGTKLLCQGGKPLSVLFGMTRNRISGQLSWQFPSWNF